MLADPVRAVRIEAARALAGPAEARLTPRDRARFDAGARRVRRGADLQRRPARGTHNLGNLYALRGDAEGAIAEYRKAIALDPTFVRRLRESRRPLSRARRRSEAEAVLREGLASAQRRGAASRAGSRARAAEAHADALQSSPRPRASTRQRPLCVCLRGGAQRDGAGRAGIEVLEPR